VPVPGFMMATGGDFVAEFGGAAGVSGDGHGDG
jgi:hypothetical protein